MRLTEDPADPDSPVVAADEGVRADPNPEKMATLKAVFAADGATTAANSSQISDGAAALLIASRAYAKQHGLKPRARFVSTAVAAADPVIQFTAVLDATRKALKESGLTLDDIDLFEVNEAFGGVPLMFQQEFGILDDRLNVNGGSIAIGHPLGSTGARMLTDLLCELERRAAAMACRRFARPRHGQRHHHRAAWMSGATMSEASEVLVSRDGAIATLTINRPRAKNSLNRAVFDGLRAQVQLRDDDTVRAVIITGAEGVFCAGADITAFDALRAEPLLGDRAAAGGHFWSELERFPKPVIAAVEKLALGGGTELALACDIAIAGESANFGVPEVKLGAIPGAGARSA